MDGVFCFSIDEMRLLQTPRKSEQNTIIPTPELYKGILGRDSLTIPTIWGDHWTANPPVCLTGRDLVRHSMNP